MNVVVAPGAMLAGSVGPEAIANPAPLTDSVETDMAEIVVSGLEIEKLSVFAPVVTPDTVCPKLMGVAGCAVSRTPVESV